MCWVQWAYAEDVDYARADAATTTFTINKAPLKITADSDTKVYDSTALTKNSYTNTDFAAGDSIESVTVTGSQTDAGSSDNVPSAAKIVNAVGEDMTADYDITYVNGKLTVTKANSAAATVTANNCTYDGTEKPLVNIDDSTLGAARCTTP